MVVLVALLGSGAAMRTLGHVDETKAARSTADKSKKPAVTASPQPPGPGDKVRDGEFEFVVQKVDCSATTVSNQILRRTADGKFCIVSLSVRNLDTESKLFSSKLQNAYDARGDKFNDDVLADFYANDNSQTFFKDIPPNGVVTGKVVFDVPKTTKLTTIELHDSLFSGGVRVKLP
jgi:hypothetical protein